MLLSNISSNNYRSYQTGRAHRVVQGVIISSRVVNVTSNNDVGTLAGGAAGAFAGSSIGGSSEANAIGAIGGAVLGGIVGNAAQNNLGKQNGIEYIIRMSGSHKLVSVTQGLQDPLHVGERVLIIYGDTTRVIRDANH